ncbi:ATP-binding cassette domain-containing protein [Myxococcota bacterium]
MDQSQSIHPDANRECQSDSGRRRVALSAEGLRVVLGGNEVLRGVDLRVERGRILGLLGPSGAGKTTLFRVLVGELRPQAGRVLLGGCDVTREPIWQRARRGLGYVPQTPNVLLDLDVKSNLRAFERVLGLARREPEEWTELVGLSGRLSVRAGQLSGGERRRLELLRALMARPQVLVCDEPLMGVDPARATALGRLLQTRAKQGMAVVIADHRIREALDFCDEAGLFLDGKLELLASAKTFAEHEAVVRRYAG